MAGRRGRRNKTHVENYYRVLGTRANISQERIREKYVAKLKEFPPETHPEEFQQIRKAYEVLRDPAQRKQYDLMRKYGTDLDGLIDDAVEYMEQLEMEKAEALLQQSLQLTPTIPAYLLLAEISLVHHRDLDMFNEYFGHLGQMDEVDEVVEPLLIAKKVELLVEADYDETAYDIAVQAEQDYPDLQVLLSKVLTMICLEMDRPEEALAWANQLLPDVNDMNMDHVDALVDFIAVLGRTGRWEAKPKVQSLIKKLASDIDEDELGIAVSIFYQEYVEYRDVGQFRSAEFVAHLLSILAPKEREFKDARKELKQLVILEKALDRMERDEELFRYVVIQARRWFMETYVPELDDFEGNERDLWAMSRDLTHMDDAEMNMAIAWSVGRLKKLHGPVYSAFREQWKELVAEVTVGMNRQERRQLMRV